MVGFRRTCQKIYHAQHGVPVIWNRLNLTMGIRMRPSTYGPFSLKRSRDRHLICENRCRYITRTPRSRPERIRLPSLAFKGPPENDVSRGAAALKQLTSFLTTGMPPSQLGILDSLAAPSISHSNALPTGRTRVTL